MTKEEIKDEITACSIKTKTLLEQDGLNELDLLKAVSELMKKILELSYELDQTVD